MSQVLLLNPRARRRKARRKNPSAAQLRARAKFAAAARARSSNPKRRRRNPVAAHPYGANHAPAASNPRRRARRRNPALRAYRSAARRRNPIGGVSMAGITSIVKETALQGAGAVAMDVAYSYVQRYLPPSLQAGPGQLTAGSAVKLLLTAVAGKMLSKHTKGLSQVAAKGALTVQFRDIVSGLLPAGTMAGMGYSVPGQVINRSARIGPNRVAGRMGAYVQSRSPLLSAYTAPGGMSPLLSGASDARAREGYAR